MIHPQENLFSKKIVCNTSLFLTHMHVVDKTYGQPVSLLVESTLDDGDIKFVVAGDMEADLDSSLSSLNPLSVPSASV